MIYVTGGSRGIGLAMAIKAAKDGAKIAIAAKTADPHPKVRMYPQLFNDYLLFYYKSNRMSVCMYCSLSNL